MQCKISHFGKLHGEENHRSSAVDMSNNQSQNSPETNASYTMLFEIEELHVEEMLRKYEIVGILKKMKKGVKSWRVFICTTTRPSVAQYFSHLVWRAHGTHKKHQPVRGEEQNTRKRSFSEEIFIFRSERLEQGEDGPYAPDQK